MNRQRIKLSARAFALACALVSLTLAAAACGGATRGVDPTAPRAEGPPYPVLLARSEERNLAARNAWARIAKDQGENAAPLAPAFMPVTDTLEALPSGAALRLPQVGGENPSEEEMRESLRRFLTDAATILGAHPSNLSLVVYEDWGEERTRAVYEQIPFAYPLRGPYGRVEVAFTKDRRIVALSSTAIPDVERLRRAFAALPIESRIAAERAVASINGRALVYADANGEMQARGVAAQGDAVARELVVYPVRSNSDPATLRLHLAWEVFVAGDPPVNVYVDAYTGERIAAVPSASR